MFKKDPISVFAAKSREEVIRRASSSGGVFTELARAVFRKGGVVVGAGWKTDPFLVAHKVACDEVGLEEMRGAKYAPSDMSGVFGRVRKELLAGRQVLFTGTPCQVAAARKLFGEDKNLLLCAIICHSVPDRDVWDRYVQELERKAKSPLVKVSFRDKCAQDGWHHSMMVVDFEDETKRIVEPLDDNAYATAFFSGFSARSVCAHCAFRRGQHGADLMIGDFWGIEDCLPEFDDRMGVSAVLVYSECGMKLLKETKLELIPVLYEDVIAKNPHIERSPKLESLGRTRFLQTYKKLGVTRALRFAKYGPWYCRIAVQLYRRLRYGSVS